MYCRRDTRRKLVCFLAGFVVVGGITVSLLGLMKKDRSLNAQNMTGDPRKSRTSFKDFAMLRHYKLGKDTILSFAVYDPRTIRRIIIFAAQPPASKPLECLFEQSKTRPIVRATRELVSPSADTNDLSNVLNFYSFECPLPKDMIVPPHSIGVQSQGTSDRIPIPVSRFPNPLHPSAPIQLAACIKSTRGNFDPVRLVEWFEMNKLLGIGNFIMYDGGVTGKAKRVFDYYSSTGALTLITDMFSSFVINKAESIIPYAFVSRREEKQKAQLLQAELASINNCIYRFKDKYNHILVIDLDDVLIPSNEEPITKLLERLVQWQPKASAYAFQSVHHFTDFGSSDTTHKIPTYLHMLRHLRRTEVDWFQAKSILVPDRVYTANWHKPRPLRPQKDTIQKVEERAGFIHHYRDHCNYWFSDRPCSKVLKSWTVDSIVPRYKDRLDANVLKILKKLNLLDSVGNGKFPSYKMDSFEGSQPKRLGLGSDKENVKPKFSINSANIPSTKRPFLSADDVNTQPKSRVTSLGANTIRPQTLSGSRDNEHLPAEAKSLGRRPTTRRPTAREYQDNKQTQPNSFGRRSTTKRPAVREYQDNKQTQPNPFGRRPTTRRPVAREYQDNKQTQPNLLDRRPTTKRPAVREYQDNRQSHPETNPPSRRPAAGERQDNGQFEPQNWPLGMRYTTRSPVLDTNPGKAKLNINSVNQRRTKRPPMVKPGNGTYATVLNMGQNVPKEAWPKSVNRNRTLDKSKDGERKSVPGISRNQLYDKSK
ncbi:uncharacterized protein LOC106166951 [Lingula anatina]|uniref:Uncharacterized protein LOC106166951 n=1 Tax=Lingula anatina TaxID=7574 RepID=A0A1S3IS86_LINAN|nr:uncharacterized protein LOC106166951 [Lingula anatina]|eukprot:XP_013401070.1 uncharacterized protein LOC106166951 [Lingula anatina]